MEEKLWLNYKEITSNYKGDSKSLQLCIDHLTIPIERQSSTETMVNFLLRKIHSKNTQNIGEVKLMTIVSPRGIYESAARNVKVQIETINP